MFEQYRPIGELERSWAERVVNITWEMKQLWDSKPVLSNLRIPEALASLYDQFTESGDGIRCRRIAQYLASQLPDEESQDEQEAEELSDPILKKLVDLGRSNFIEKWYHDSTGVREDFKRLLARFGLDESAIRTQAMQMAAQDLESIDRRLLTLEARFERALRLLEDRPRVIDNDGPAKVIVEGRQADDD